MPPYPVRARHAKLQRLDGVLTNGIHHGFASSRILLKKEAERVTFKYRFFVENSAFHLPRQHVAGARELVEGKGCVLPLLGLPGNFVRLVASAEYGVAIVDPGSQHG
jgi:hypothetical protein